jgi:hypothetical protein
MKEERKPCKLNIDFDEDGIAVAATCDCGVSFTPPQSMDETNLEYFQQQFRRHNAGRYGSLNI